MTHPKAIPDAVASEVRVALDSASLDAIVGLITVRVLEHLRSEESSPTWMTLAETSEYLRWSKHRIYKLTSARAIPHIKQEGRLLFNRTELDRWLAAHHQGPRPGDIA